MARSANRSQPASVSFVQKETSTKGWLNLYPHGMTPKQHELWQLLLQTHEALANEIGKAAGYPVNINPTRQHVGFIERTDRTRKNEANFNKK